MENGDASNYRTSYSPNLVNPVTIPLNANQITSPTPNACLYDPCLTNVHTPYECAIQPIDVVNNSR